jgi:hypothetical protein
MIISNYQYFFIENGRKWNIIFYLYHEEIELLILKIVKKDKILFIFLKSLYII